jgi:hypothetical protein
MMALAWSAPAGKFPKGSVAIECLVNVHILARDVVNGLLCIEALHRFFYFIAKHSQFFFEFSFRINCHLPLSRVIRQMPWAKVRNRRPFGKSA